MAIRRVIARLPDPVIDNLKSVVGQLARSKVFSSEGDSVTQEQTVALCIQLVSQKLVEMTPDRIRKTVSDDVASVLSLYAEHRESA